MKALLDILLNTWWAWEKHKQARLRPKQNQLAIMGTISTKDPTVRIIKH